MPRAATATPVVPASSSDILLLALMSRKNGSTADRISDIVCNTTGSVVRGTTEVLSRSFGGIGNVWDAGVVVGEVDGACYARDMLKRAAIRNGLTTEAMAALIAASSTEAATT